ncbi:MAG: tetratricopeptide repeat protein, partial [Myxococcales bacterium]|nr:tetratricopeptide repeat protein [Myxococcales bacterium]
MLYLIRALHRAPVLVVAAGTPELVVRKPRWLDASKQRHRHFELGALSREESEALLVQLLEPLDDPPDALVHTAVELSGGSPYLLEEMVRTFYQTGVLFATDAGVIQVNMDRLDRAELPLTVDQAIEARVSFLQPAARGLLEMAAAIGNTFWLGSLVALLRMEEEAPELWGGHESTVAHARDLLRELVERGFIREKSESAIEGETEFAFRHDREREAVVQLTNRKQSEAFHKLTGEWLECRVGDREEKQCELLAQHFELGGVPWKSARYYITAGDGAKARHANTKAAAFYSRALELIGDTDRSLRLEALHSLGSVLQLAGRNDAALRVFREMLQCAFRLNLKEKGGAAHNRLGRLYRATGKLDEAMRHLGTGLALFEAARDSRGIASSLDDVGKVHWLRGNYEAGERFARQALERRQALGDPRSIALSFNNLGLIYQDSGRFAEALDAFQQALSIQQEHGDKAGIAQTMNNLGTIYQDNGDHESAVERYQSALEMAKDVGDRMRQAVILTNLGESHYRLQKTTQAIALLTEAEELSATLGDLILEGEILRGLAKAHLLAKDTNLAKDYIARALDRFREARGKSFLGSALRTKGEIFGTASWGTEEAA